jgi:hypothetical protein
MSLGFIKLFILNFELWRCDDLPIDNLGFLFVDDKINDFLDFVYCGYFCC